MLWRKRNQWSRRLWLEPSSETGEVKLINQAHRIDFMGKDGTPPCRVVVQTESGEWVSRWEWASDEAASDFANWVVKRGRIKRRMWVDLMTLEGEANADQNETN